MGLRRHPRAWVIDYALSSAQPRDDAKMCVIDLGAGANDPQLHASIRIDDKYRRQTPPLHN